MIKHWITILGIASLLTGCSMVPKDSGLDEVKAMTSNRLGVEIIKNSSEDFDTQSIESISRSLTPASAVQIALYNNPRVQIALQELGIARAEMIEALILDNPSLGGSIQWPEEGGGYLLDFELGQNVHKLILMPSNKKLTALQLEEAQLRVVDEILHVAAETEGKFYDAVAARHLNKMHSLIAESTAASYEYADRLYDAGNINDLELARELAMFEEARLNLAESELMAAVTREELLRLLGIWNDEKNSYLIPDELPMLPEGEIELGLLEQFAVENNIKLAVHRKQVDVMAQALGISRDWRWLGTVEFGAIAERELDGEWLAGPSLNLEIPIFNRNQSEVTRQEAQLRQREYQLIETAIDVRLMVRMERQKLYVKRQKAKHLLSVVIPNRERIVSLSQRQYNYMLVGVFEVLQAKNDEYESYQEYIETLRDYWMTRAELRKVVGGQLPEDSELEKVNRSLSESQPVPESAPTMNAHLNHGGMNQ